MIGSTRFTATAEIARQGKLSSEIARLQQQISSGKRLVTASDDPNAAIRISDIRRTQADAAVWKQNAETGATVASAVDNNLSTVASALDRAKEILLAARSGSSSAENRASYATELEGIAQDIDSYAAANDPTGRPLFPSGTPLAFPVSETLSLPATASRADTFGIPNSAGGTQTIADFLRAAATRLRGDDATTITGDIATLDGAITQIAGVRTAQGIRAQRFADVQDRIAATATDLKIELSALEDTDLTYALSEMQAKQLALQAAQATFAQANKTTLFDRIS